MRTRGGVAVRCVDVGHVYRLEGIEVRALSGVSFALTAGDAVALLGPSGSGKSTLTALISGLRRPAYGEVWIGTDRISTLPEPEVLQVRGREIGIVVQNPARSLLPYGTVEDNIMFAQHSLPRAQRKGLPSARDLLAALDLGALSGRRTARLSGGEQQRLAVAVAMAVSPRVLLADEPTSQLDGANRDRVVEMLLRIRAEFGTTLIVVTHDPVVAAPLERRVTLSEGRVVGVLDGRYPRTASSC